MQFCQQGPHAERQLTWPQVRQTYIATHGQAQRHLRQTCVLQTGDRPNTQLLITGYYCNAHAVTIYTRNELDSKGRICPTQIKTPFEMNFKSDIGLNRTTRTTLLLFKTLLLIWPTVKSHANLKTQHGLLFQGEWVLDEQETVSEEPDSVGNAFFSG